ncbi:hypothetical protein [Methylobacterium aquaticum]|uniref:Uncharacterized protein n=1 Tax=Methylobacterium aquaticum TaxID=270351 RepID=A0A0C6FH60_9HYPH|nr:hypothetical protein [Methylobacterium aquaticum]BAQ44414.1 conserved in methylobacterium species, unknown protein [Methylobacterium aquaticum]
MHRTFPAALALACVCSPAMAGTLGLGEASALHHYAARGSLIFAGIFAVLIIAAHVRGRVPAPDARIWLIPLAFMMTTPFGPAIAAEVATADTTRVTLSAAPWIELVREIVITAVIPAVAAYLIQAIRKVYPWAALFLTQARVEQMANAVTEYAINAVPGAVKEGKLSVNVGSQVIAKAVQRAVDAAPAKALEAAGGQAGLAEIVFRKLNLEDGANEDNTLAPVVAGLPAAR